MGIRIGTQLVAPGGFKLLESGVTYYFLWSDSSRERVHLVQFVMRPPKTRRKPTREGRVLTETPTPLAMLVAMRRSQFELGVESSAILHHDHQAALPPWLEPLSGKNLASIDLLRPKAKKKHAQRIDDMLEAIYPLVMKYKEVLGAENPDKLINKHARACSPVKNETRVRLAFYCYLLFGRSRNALHYPIHKIGGWDRDLQIDGKKRGRKREGKGVNYGHNVSSVIHKRIVESYRKYSGLGISMTEIYRISMSKTFGCRERPDRDGLLSYYHPDGEPFPTYGQFDCHVADELGRGEIQKRRLGPNLVRGKIAPSLGPFTRAVANLMERVEADGYYCGERPIGLVEKSTLPHLCVVRKRDVASGALTAVGFSFAAERASAYRMATFCEAIDKVKFCSLFGIAIEAWEWPSIGTGAHGTADRGPGSTDGAFSADLEMQPVFRVMPPSYAGQSKAVMESSNPKKIKNQEAPSHLRSEKSVFQLSLREIRRVILDNESIDITDRITPDLWDKVRKPCPNALWTVLDELGRNDAVLVTFEDAVRAYLDQVEIVVKAGGIDLHGQRYDSRALRATGLLDRVAVSQVMRMKAYVLEACVRHIWVDIDNQLIELDLQASLRAGDEILFMSLNEIKQREIEMRAMAPAFLEHRHATASKAHRAYEEETGLKWNSASRHSGSAKSGTSIARQETAESALAMSGRKRA
ncbi:hypothetical protein SAMN05216344_10557 [Polaromonas sp. OV174]|uniref:transposase n=1 Tax=Polaromonas sp. OV174 TaxID=1855300 RepID=UPI0008E2E720|nr:transposase [Polaromonas sp. OV174]SFB90169.1 hypothetical protein SAMN05216344_10557 [Polaromonas sp. OV174]